MICINVGAPWQRYKLRAQNKKSDFVQKAGHFHDLAGHGTSGKKAGLSRQKRDDWQVWIEGNISAVLNFVFSAATYKYDYNEQGQLWAKWNN